MRCDDHQVPADGTFVAPTLIELERVSDLKQEVFGPVLHVVRYHAEDLDLVIADIAASGYGLTLGIHTRIDATVERIIQRLPVGNIYVNRNMIGAVVGTQPFGGVGLSGTGPKAGGPNYVRRFASEQTVSINTAAAGGNATLLAQGD
jgi:RHH-type proline utilization regulon transcriptional repressor/proline dehydrogenase/delta 1-pyrroline-5-carboxylate dehydrogenase